MKNTLQYLACIMLLFWAFRSHAKEGGNDTLFTITDAKTILGEGCTLSETKTTKEAKSTMYRSTYLANRKDPVSNKTGNVYYLLEWYNDEVSAHEEYIHIKTMNEKNGIQPLTGYGDEAYFHTDKQNFLFILARKGKKMYRLKVNKITSNTSQQKFMDISKRIAKEM